MRQHSAHALVAPWVGAVSPARVVGYRLFDCGAYPTVWPTPGREVHGEVLSLRDPIAALARLDEYEECPGEYRREQTMVHLEGGETTEAWIYVLSSQPTGIWRPMAGDRWAP